MSEGKTPQRDRLDALLAEWPASARSPAEWDESAADVLAKLGGEAVSASSVSDEALLGAPLLATPDQVSGSVPASARKGSAEGVMNTTSRERDRASLKELAKLADLAPSSSRAPSSRPIQAAEPTEERKEDSGLIDLAALAASDAAAPAAPATVAASAPPAAAAPVVAQKPATSPERPRRSAWVIYGGVVAAAAVAAGVFFNLSTSSTSTAVVAAAPVAAPATANAPIPANVEPTPIAASDRGIDPSALPQADLPGTPHGPTNSSAHAAVAASPVAAAGPSSPAQPETTPEPVAATPPAPAPTSSQSLEALMQQAAGVSSTAAAPTATDTPAPAAAPGSVPLKPSQGAVQGAIGAVLPGARACLDPDDPISRVSVTFQSDGSVQSVSVSGGAAGKPAEACIRSALTRARVQPFAQPTFSFGTTVRPN